MAYKKPGAYARFVRTAGAVNSPGASRVMALVGTGKLFFDRYNEAVLRTNGATADKLAFSNVIEIDEITNKPFKNGAVPSDAIKYSPTTHYELIGGNTISWKTVATTGVPKVEEVGGTAPAGFADAVSASVASDAYNVIDGKYRVQITYIDNEADGEEYGTFAVIDHNTEEVLGEYTVSPTAVTAIPGVSLIVTQTNVVDATEGDYVIINTTAGITVPGTPALGDVYYISYRYKKADSEFAPKIFTDYADVVAEYGNYDVTASGLVINSLALGAEIAFLNGIQPLVLVQAKNDSDFEMKEAINKLERDVMGITNVNTIVPLSTSKNVAAHAMTHVNSMSDSAIGKERMLYLSAVDGESASTSADNAAGFGNERVIYVTPGAAIKEIKDINTGKINLRRVPGSYLAIAVAALGLKNDPAEPLTNKNITGFAALGELYSESEKNIMAEKGVLVLEQNGFNMKVRHGITTSTAEVNSAEITLVQIKDYVIEATRTNLADLYVGRKLMPTILGDVQTTLSSVLSQFQAQQVIIGFGGVSVKRSPEDPRAIDVVFEIEAVYPLNYINISFSFAGVN